MLVDDVRGLAREREVVSYDVVGIAQPALDDLARLAAGTTGLPIVMINLMLAESQATVAAVGIGPSACSREDSMCNAILYDGHPVEVRDAREDPRWADNPFVTGVEASFRFYYAHQLVSPRGVVIGTLCVFDRKPHELDAEQRSTLGNIARWIVDLLELRLRSNELERSVAELTQAHDELRRSNQLLGLFASQVAHDLRGPITAMSASLDMLRDEEPALSPRQEWLVGHATAGVRRMDSLVDDVLRMSRLDGELRKSYVDLEQLVRRVQEDLAVELGRVEVVRGSLPLVIGDETQIRIVVQNLLSNAAKFTRGTPHPRVCVEAGSDARSWWLEVGDNGPGVDAADRVRIFGLGERGGGAPVDEGDRPGLGLGLATCRRIVAAHDGTITMGATAEGGALVRVVVPVTRAGQVQAALAAADVTPG